MPSMALGGDPGNMVSFLQAGIVSQAPNFLCPFECPKLGYSEEAAAAEEAGEETTGALGWCGSQLLTLVTDRPCHFLSCSPRGEEFLQGNHALLCLEYPVRKAPPQRGAGGSRVDEVGAPHGVVLLLCPSSGKLPAAEPGLDQLPTPTQAWLSSARS